MFIRLSGVAGNSESGCKSKADMEAAGCMDVFRDHSRIQRYCLTFLNNNALASFALDYELENDGYA